ncbi:MAG: sulfatase-like hydrolase/transferase [Proteobacteria bacterium]|nr:sulfatase-like hydrolase/transferase [Pseudomonadota bacterium]
MPLQITRERMPRGLSVPVVLIAAAVAALGCGPTGARSQPPPRVLIVTIDTLRADHVGAYGGPVPTPAIDGVATAGALLLDACTPTPSTGPAHASLWTGLHPWRHGVLDNAVPLGADVPTIGEVAQKAGVATAAFVSSYMLAPRFGLSRGFDTYHFEASESYLWRGRDQKAFWTRADATTDAALGWLHDHRRGPFLLWVHYFDPHAPYTPPPGFERPIGERVSLDGKSLPACSRACARSTCSTRRPSSSPPITARVSVTTGCSSMARTSSRNSCTSRSQCAVRASRLAGVSPVRRSSKTSRRRRWSF